MDTTTNTTGTSPLNGSYTYNACSCAHRLPCGYCPLLSRPCPMQGLQINPYSPQWTISTCQNGSPEGVITNERGAK